jgi:ATP-citrate lyase beta-subunit
MAQKGIREFAARRLMAKWLPELAGIHYEGKVALIGPETDLKKVAAEHPWVLDHKLVVKPDQLFGKRGKHGLLCLDKDWPEAQEWIAEHMGRETQVGSTRGILSHFLVEPFVPHERDREYYVALRSNREGDTIYFSRSGGVDIEENWEKVKQIDVPASTDIDSLNLQKELSLESNGQTKAVVDFVTGLFIFYRKLNFTYLEINPFTIADGKAVPLDTVARLDDTAAFECAEYWEGIEFPPAFGKTRTAEEEYISQLDEKSGSSLKLTILNPEGRVWLMVAGGGASVIYADTVVDLGCMNELANYGEYSGNPSTDETREYAKTILDLMTRKKYPGGKVLLIGGGIANFTDVAKTFTGIIEALTEFREKLVEHNIKIYVRRGGPNYREGLGKMKKLGSQLGVPIEVYGPDTHMTRIVPRAIEALGLSGGDR